jgi:hypothetical protein
MLLGRGRRIAEAPQIACRGGWIEMRSYLLLLRPDQRLQCCRVDMLVVYFEAIPQISGND